MNKEMSENLTQVGPGTRMGALLRRYWVPALMSSEIAEPDGPQVRVQLLGEKLLAFRNTEGKADGAPDRESGERRDQCVPRRRQH